MKKINHKILSLPPYISTSWKNINTLHMKDSDGNSTLVVVLHNGSMIEIPNLDSPILEQVFTAHGKFLEQESQEQSESLKQYDGGQNSNNPFSIGIPLQIGNSGNTLDNLGSFLHHNSDQANAPDLPSEILHKIASISKTLGMDLEQMSIPKAEPHCNCTYCQIARAIQTNNLDFEEEKTEELVSDDDLKFRDWEIKQKSKELYEITNPIDKNEHYQVFLGHPVGCTCGQKNCEHIRTVLNS